MIFFHRLREKLARIRGRKRGDRLTLIIFAGLAAAVVIGSSLLSGSAPRGASLFEKGEGPDLRRLLPAGAATAAESVVELPDATRPAYAVGYTLGRNVDIALIVWDSAVSRYVLAADRNFGTVKEGITPQIPSLSLRSLGAGASPAIMVRSQAADASTGVFFMARNGSALDYVQMRDGLGEIGPAFFVDGKLPSEDNGTTVWQDESALVFEDIDMDGKDEAIETVRTYGAKKAVSVSVYVWRDGLLDFDKDLSKAMTTDAEIFVTP